ncbi:MAG TPA: YbjN domain-containing protein [Myxococcota bacterium]|nr:YbjN domain-containing protein [Myxococcota bacterium]
MDQQQESALLAAMKQFFEEDGWAYDERDDRAVLRVSIDGQSGKFAGFSIAYDDRSQLCFYTVLPMNAPAERRLPVAEFIARANYNMIIGNFEIDFSDGEIRYKTSIDIEGGTLTQMMCKNLVYANVTTMDRYFPGLAAVIAGAKSPAEAVAEIEG